MALSQRKLRFLRKLYTDSESPNAFGSAKRLFDVANLYDDTITRADVAAAWKELKTPSKFQETRKFKRMPVVISGPGITWAADLMFFSYPKGPNKGFTMALVVIDAFSRKV